MTSLQLSIVHFTAAELSLVCWFRRFEGCTDSAKWTCGDNSLVALKLLSPDGDNAWLLVMYKLSQALSDIEVQCRCLECEGEPCLFVNCGLRVCCNMPIEKFWCW
ncbi:hypothetical protein ACNKHS_13320 [Shigella flexneri]